MDFASLRAELDHLGRQLERAPRWPELRAVYLDMTPLVGQLQAAVDEKLRSATSNREEEPAILQTAFEELKASFRQVGLDLRLASEPALRVGLETVIDAARDVLAVLQSVG